MLAALAKVTTWPGFVAAYCIYIGCETFRRRSVPVASLVTGGAGVFLAVGLSLAWTYYSDQVKMLNILGSHLTAASVRGFIFGTWSQLFSQKLWLDLLDPLLGSIFTNGPGGSASFRLG